MKKLKIKLLYFPFQENKKIKNYILKFLVMILSWFVCELREIILGERTN